MELSHLPDGAGVWQTGVTTLWRVAPPKRYPKTKHSLARSHTGVCEKNTPPEKTTLGQISMKHTESGAGEQLLLLGRMAKAPHVKGLLFHRHRIIV